ncbi:Hsp20/alpha crystallin family protein [Sphingobacteriaceae bacterium WQ 2009]|uniref:Hsp20/alpha crystallin family protein n=1 Tax=Rhinopithecimicrobium faecis TaxID=2820698 RepID=A0A8T4H6K6_9SPHI|nr:Hsp20/alpha crystallin family protein [Sphingobacteriaceae bacterium WQ 2009]
MALVKFSHNASNHETAPFVNRVFDSFFNDSYLNDRVISRVPAVNVAESENAFHIEFAAPGLQKSDFKINIDNHTLIVSAERSEESKEETKVYNRREYAYGTFTRSFTLPKTVDINLIEAVYEAGILAVTITKKEEAKVVSRSIDVK